MIPQSRAHRLASRTPWESLFLSCLFPFLMADATAADLARFSIAEPLGIARAEAPVTGGLPLARGVAADVRVLSLADENGNAIPAQIQPLARWNSDGSLKWVLVDLQTDLAADGSKQFRLRAGKPGPRPPHQITVRETEKFVTVDTGRLKFKIRRKNFNFIDQAWVRTGKDETQVVNAGRDGGVRVVDWKKTVYWSHADSDSVVELEERGPLRTVVHARGRHLAADGNSFCQWDVRIHAFAGRSDLKVFHTFIFDGDPEADLIRDVSLHLPLAFSPDPKNRPERIWSAMLDDDLFSLPIHRDDARKYVELIQERDGLAKLYIETFKKLPIGPIDVARVDRTGRIVSRARPWYYQSIETGRKAPGIVDYSIAEFGASVAVRHFAEQYPNEIQIHPATESIRLHLWPEHGDPMNLSRGRQRSAYSGQEGVGNAIGLGKTQELLIHFHAGAQPDLPLLRSQAKRLLPRLDPEYVAATKVFGNIHPHDPRNYPEIETALETLFDWQIRHVNENRWHGKWDFGATQIKWNNRAAMWSQIARHGWTVNEVSNTYGPWIMFARSGDRKYFDWAEINTRYLIDVGTSHAGPTKGAQRRHAEKQWSGGTDSTHTYLHAPLAYYYFTGDRRAYDVLLESAAHMLDTHRRAEILVGKGDGKWSDAGKRGYVNPLNAFALLYELTGEEKYQTAARKRIKAWADSGSTGHAGYVAFALEEWMMRHGFDADLKGRYLRLASIRTKPKPTATTAYEFISGNRARAPSPSGVWINQPAPAHLGRFWHGQLFRTMGEAYRLSGNKNFLRTGLADLYDYLGKADRSDDWRYRGQPRGWMTSLNANLLFNVPYFLSALDSLPDATRRELIKAARDAR
jgi:hypothetical protein